MRHFIDARCDIFFIDDRFLRTLQKREILALISSDKGFSQRQRIISGTMPISRKVLDGVLGRFCLHFASGFEIGDIGQVDVDAIFWPFIAELPDRFEEGERFDVADRAADFDDDDLDVSSLGSQQAKIVILISSVT